MVTELPFTAPLDWDTMLGFLARRAIPGVESIDATRYRRSVEIDGHAAGLEVSRRAAADCLALRISPPATIASQSIVHRVRRLFDLDCRPDEIARHLADDDEIGGLVRRRPGVRIPGAWDPFELAIRAILGQQVSVRGASTLAGRLVAAFGVPVVVDVPGITHTFPSPAALAEGDVGRIGVPRARADTIRGIARAILERDLVLDGSQGVDEVVRSLRTIKGVGPWTAEYIAMRALGDRDAFPVGDLGVKKALARGRTLRDADLLRIAEPWRPYRAYAVMHLWTA